MFYAQRAHQLRGPLQFGVRPLYGLIELSGARRLRWDPQVPQTKSTPTVNQQDQQDQGVYVYRAQSGRRGAAAPVTDGKALKPQLADGLVAQDPGKVAVDPNID